MSVPTIPMDDYDWREAFGCAGDPEGEFNSADVRRANPADSEISIAPFGRLDVEEVYAKQDGEADERDWMVLGKLKDGRYFFLSAGCDYTGWDCQSGGCAFVAGSREEIERYGMDQHERDALGIPEPSASLP